jgi:Icc-related predicted phosphoesterase
MRLFTLSDIHGNTHFIGKFARKAQESNVNLIIIAGDITHFAGAEKAKSIINILKTGKLPVIFVPGNCDLPETAKLITDDCFCLHNNFKIFGNYCFIGVGGSNPTPFGTLFELREQDISKILEEIANKVQNCKNLILISHFPPFNTKVDDIMGNAAQFAHHVGSEAIRKFIEKFKPRLVICGHIHEGLGTDKIGETVIVNPGPAREGHFAIIEIDDSKIEVKLDSIS